MTLLFKYDLLTLELYLSKRVRRFDPSSTGLDHVLVSRVLPPISEATHVTPVREQGP